VAHALSVETRKPYVVLRKVYPSLHGETIQAETISITTGKPNTSTLMKKTGNY